MFLTTTLYFKGIWKNPFNTSFTKVEPFFNEKGNLIGNVQMMYRNGVYPYAKIKDISAYAVELPYNVIGNWFVFLRRIDILQMFTG